MKVTTYCINKGTASQYFGLKDVDENRVLYGAPNNWKTEKGAIRWAEKHGYEVVKVEEKKIANNSTEFINKAEAAIREVLNGKEGQQIVNTMLTEALKKNPNMTPEEWSQMKAQFMTFVFAMFVKGNPDAMRELGTHIYNELRAQ